MQEDKKAKGRIEKRMKEIIGLEVDEKVKELDRKRTGGGEKESE